MDRTTEFVRITQLFTDAPILLAKHRPLSAYARVAQRISDALLEKEMLLRGLATLALKKHMTAEDDPTKEISSICDITKQSLPILAKEINEFQQAVQGDNQQQRHFSVICASLNSRMAKCVKELQDGMQTRANVIKEINDRRKRFSHAGPHVQINTPLTLRAKPPSPPTIPAAPRMGSAVPYASSSHPTSSYPHAGNYQTTGNSNYNHHAAVATPTELPGAQSAPLLRRRPNMNQNSTASAYVQQQQQQASMQRYTAQARLNDAKHIESTIVEISSMYNRMSSLIASQGEVLERIDDDMTTAQMNVEAGHNELLKYFTSMSGNRSLILKIFLILVVFIYLFLVVF
ncbi:hypothetical protein SPRG_07267 [Saprolegnia parasitica CBS 223.65]|uniref:t-SNARE coiled-coil homology domain-containing protein n=1 Tax=Saprolegnia parasitica (strain CBS 223.65) TaxID=695850 RepID=A0A067CB32_SAPPC|nr:hypothetical protein SPRG_07267 [Saprolegnia parasitica CBS 223.65]KDO27989.1 hypothetical protein SPRG_07267 [Saprolegnia parasitica CBS 223.65]|eukprot:XP_012201438.1 hypothetical protein SPRG_07267 [Saprolegnia parasitica CBS 223.65]